MRRVLAIWALGLLTIIAGWQLVPARGQVMLMTGAGLGTAAAFVYTGPGDVVSGAKAWWGLRAYNSAKRGTAAVNVCIPLDATCADLSTDATTGALVIGTIGGSSCSVVTCTVKTFYDQSGALYCSGSVACDLTQATIANRPVLTVSCATTSKPCLTWAAGQGFTAVAAIGTAFTQPYSAMVVMQRTGAFTSSATGVGIGAAGQVQLGLLNSANTAFTFANAVNSTAASDSTWHVLQGVFSSLGTGNTSVDAASHVASNGSATGSGLSFCMAFGCANGVVGLIDEGGWWQADNTTNFGALNTNAKTYWGF